MDQSSVASVRRFNRTVTQRVGALDDKYLRRGRSLGASRVLWEVDEDGCDVRRLRARLSLDSGYLSRLLRSLEASGLVRVGVDRHDRRVRTVHLTAKGRRERAVLDERSDRLAGALLEPLTASQQQRLVTAMAEVERLLTSGAVALVEADPTSPAARHCLREYAAELDHRFPTGFDTGRSRLPDHGDLRPPRGLLVLATLAGEPVGCGGLRFHDDGQPTELKRMWVSPSVRGLGVGRRLLTDLERRAAATGHVLRLDTNGVLVEAISLYRSAGWREVDAFNDEPFADHWFEKRLDEG
jgi:DNA-binding MarR family transcriptional regulator/GNAT superfamily N-acetyltransferase